MLWTDVHKSDKTTWIHELDSGWWITNCCSSYSMWHMCNCAMPQFRIPCEKMNLMNIVSFNDFAIEMSVACTNSIKMIGQLPYVCDVCISMQFISEFGEWVWTVTAATMSILQHMVVFVPTILSQIILPYSQLISSLCVAIVFWVIYLSKYGCRSTCALAQSSYAPWAGNYHSYSWSHTKLRLYTFVCIMATA